MVIRINMAAEKPQEKAVGFLLVSIVFRWLGRKSFSPYSTKSHSCRQHCPLDPPHLFSVLAFVKDSEGGNQISNEERLPNNRIEGKNQMQAWISSVGIRATIKRKRVGIGQQWSPEWSNSYIRMSQLGPFLELLRSCLTPAPLQDAGALMVSISKLMMSFSFYKWGNGQGEMKQLWVKAVKVNFTRQHDWCPDI